MIFISKISNLLFQGMSISQSSLPGLKSGIRDRQKFHSGIFHFIILFVYIFKLKLNLSFYLFKFLS